MVGFSLDSSEVARSIELYLLERRLKDEAGKGKFVLELTKEPARNRPDVKNVAVAFGSFDPLSISHEALFLNGLDLVKKLNGRSFLDELLVVISTSHFEKSIDLKKNSAIYDRIHALEGFAGHFNDVSVGFFNNAFFVNLVEAIGKKYGNAAFYFLVGSDVMDKIANPSSYEKFGFDPEDVFCKLFQHNFILGPRVMETPNGKKSVSLDDLSRKYPVFNSYPGHFIEANLVDPLFSRDGTEISEMSSTRIRAMRRNGEDVYNFTAVGVNDFINSRGIYLDGNTYEAFACARQRFANVHPNEPIGSYLPELMDYLPGLFNSEELCENEIRNYANIA